jgi:hypothetical protein
MLPASGTFSTSPPTNGLHPTRTRNGPKIHFDGKGRISRIESNGKYADFAYDPQERLHRIVSSRGRLYELLYSDLTTQKPYAVVIDGHEETLPLKAPPHAKSTEKQ